MSAFVQRLQAIAGDVTDTASGNLHKGLLDYRVADAEIFFGRDRAKLARGDFARA